VAAALLYPDSLRRHFESTSKGVHVAEINVVAVLKAKEGKESAVGDALQSALPASRKDAGCIRYDLFVAQGAPGTFVMLETWASKDELNAHLGSPHLGAAFASVGDAFDGAPQTFLLDAVDVA
jgi:quinol monooxygenase YgiN